MIPPEAGKDIPNPYETLRVTTDGPVATVLMSRPDVYNALNLTMINELTDFFGGISQDSPIRAVVLAGADRAFSAGADLNWMRSALGNTPDANIEDTLKLADLFETMQSCPRPIVAKIHNFAIGGGVGLVAACDIAVAEEGTKFAFSEARLGIVPAVISRFVVPRIGMTHARELFLTGERFDAEHALRIELINRVAPKGKLDEVVNDRLVQLLQAGPRAQLATKQRLLPRHTNDEGLRQFTAELTAELRASEEGQEGMIAMLDKLIPSWIESLPDQYRIKLRS